MNWFGLHGTYTQVHILACTKKLGTSGGMLLYSWHCNRILIHERETWERVGHGRWWDMGEGGTSERVGHGRGLDMGDGVTWEMVGHGRGWDMGDGGTWKRV